MMKLFSFQPVLFRKLSPRALATVPTVSDANPDKNKEIAQNVLSNKLKVTDTLRTNLENLSKRWKEKYEVYYGKDRDLVKYPMPTMQDHHPKVRMGVIPDEWFNSLYAKTGVTGPYLFFWGGLLFMIQKEIWVVDHYFMEVPVSIAVIYALHRKVGPHFGAFYRKYVDRKLWFISKRDPVIFTSVAKKAIEIANEDKKCADVNVDLFQATKENVSLQLECVYRNRALMIHKAVKSRLDYQVDKELTKQRFQRSYMINWIVNSVVKDFTPQQEKATLAQCLSDLKLLGQNLKAAKA